MRDKKEIRLTKSIKIRWNKYYPQLVIYEKYEKLFIWLLRSLTLIGLISSVIALPIWYLNLLTAIILLVIEQVIEKAVFVFTTMLVRPFPNFKHDTFKWDAMVFAFPMNNVNENLNIVGCGFKDIQYGYHFFDLLKSWNSMNNSDKENNICLSFIIEPYEEYSVYIYPNLHSKIVEDFRTTVENKFKYEKYGREHEMLVFQMILHRYFPYTSKSNVNIFNKVQHIEKPFLFKPFKVDKNLKPSLENDYEPIIKYHYKFKKRDQLQKHEVEYMHGKKVMKIK